MLELSVIASVLAIHIFAWLTPGPLFVLLIRNSLAYSRKTGLWTAVGIALGNFIHILYSVTGIALLLSTSEIAFNLVKYVGVGYLTYLGIKTLTLYSPSEAFADCSSTKDLSPFQAFKTGFLTNILSPKASLFFASIFAGIMAKKVAWWAILFLVAAMPLNSLIMASLLSIVFTHEKIRKVYHAKQRIVNFLLGGALLMLAALILFKT